MRKRYDNCSQKKFEFRFDYFSTFGHLMLHIFSIAIKSGPVSMSSEMHQKTQVIGSKKEALLISHVHEMYKVIR